MTKASKRIWGRSACLCMVLCAGAAAPAWPQTVPAGVRACTTLSDPSQRLACYDREAGRTGTPTAGSLRTGGSSSSPQAGTARPVLPAQTRSQAGTASPPQRTLSKAKSTRVAHRRHRFTAHIVAVEHREEGLFLRLDNGQVWQETQTVDGDLSLKPGDTVEIEEHLGSFWLKGPHVYDMNVRRQ